MGKAETGSVRIFLIDDHPVMRNGLSLLLTQIGHTICAEAGSRAEVLRRIDASGAEIAVVDLSLAEESGLDLIDDLSSRNIPTLIYSMHEDWGVIERAFDRGARGYVTKREVANVLIEAIAEIVSGQRYTSPRVMRSLASHLHRQDDGGAAELSSREEQILNRLGSGETSAEIGQALHISAHTVETYYARIIKKLGLPSMKELRKLAIQRRA
jgi:DNA-binding NarL/FixJ family response regulator